MKTKFTAGKYSILCQFCVFEIRNFMRGLFQKRKICENMLKHIWARPTYKYKPTTLAEYECTSHQPIVKIVLSQVHVLHLYSDIGLLCRHVRRFLERGLQPGVWGVPKWVSMGAVAQHPLQGGGAEPPEKKF